MVSCDLASRPHFSRPVGLAERHTPPIAGHGGRVTCHLLNNPPPPAPQVHPELPAIPEQHDGCGLHPGARCRLPPRTRRVPHRAGAFPFRLPGMGLVGALWGTGGVGTTRGWGQLEEEPLEIQLGDGDSWRRNCWRYNQGMGTTEGGTVGGGTVGDTTRGWGQLEEEPFEIQPGDGGNWRRNSWRYNQGMGTTGG